jgi:hypothetical protein
MAAPELDFNFYAGGIEDGILAALKAALPAGVKATFGTYSGQLENPDELKKALGEMTPVFPLIMASYAEGFDEPEAVSPVLGLSRPYKHMCEFGIIVASDDARGEDARRRGTFGTYPLIAFVKEVLTELLLTMEVEESKYQLTISPLRPTTSEVVLKMANITAYIIFFQTAFRWYSKDRQQAGVPVSEFVLQVDSLNDQGGNPGNMPGVEFETSGN